MTTPDTTPAFWLSDVGYRYGEGVVALRGVSLTIGMGETVAILGANGCGKSTLIKMLDGLIHPLEGRIEAFGEPLTEESLRDEKFAYRFRRRVGFIFQNSDAQLFSPTVRDEIAFGPLQMGLSVEETEGRIRDVAALLDITRLLERPPFQLSGGEKKRVAIACSLAVNPDVLLLDEPTNGLDPRSQYALVELLVRLSAAGKTLITATHDLNIVPRIATRALVFSEEHTVVADASSREILADLPLLLRVNLIHEHLHRHGEIIHAHPHPHDHEHTHTHPTDMGEISAP
ncbi:MAG: ABC-type cobalt transport system, ATPase component [Chthonomonadaceae bacterium]|nr:ABC-type cobalt transport system, ATPase component [Chthonomonadaceae bacterium]